MPGGRATALGSARAREVHEVERGAVAHEQPRAVVVAGRYASSASTAPPPLRDGPSERQFAPRALGRVLGVTERLVGQPRAHALLVDGQPRAPREFVVPAEDPRRPVVEDRHRRSSAARGLRRGWRRRSAARRGRPVTRPPGGTWRVTLPTPGAAVPSRAVRPPCSRVPRVPCAHAYPSAPRRGGPRSARLVPCLPACRPRPSRSPRPASRTLSTILNKGKHLTYYVQYTSRQQRSEDHDHHRPGAAEVLLLGSSAAAVINTGKTTYYCDAAGNSGNSGNRQLRAIRATPATRGIPGAPGATTTTTTTKASMTLRGRPRGPSPHSGLEDLFSPRHRARSHQRGGAQPRPRARSGSMSLASSATFAGQPSTCLTVTTHSKRGKYCVTKRASTRTRAPRRPATSR